MDDTLKRFDELDPDKFVGARSFLLLNLTFKLYYLLAPEGVLLDDFRYIQGIFFANNKDTNMQKNYYMADEFRKLSKKPKEEILKSLYSVKATFAVVKPTPYAEVADFIKSEIEKIAWYQNNKYPDIQQAICEYIVAYTCFFFGMVSPVYDFFDVFWQVVNSDYYKKLGFKQDYYNSNSKQFNRNNIEKELNRIVSEYRNEYPNMQFQVSALRYNSNADFVTSFLYETEKLNLNTR